MVRAESEREADRQTEIEAGRESIPSMMTPSWTLRERLQFLISGSGDHDREDHLQPRGEGPGIFHNLIFLLPTLISQNVFIN